MALIPAAAAVFTLLLTSCNLVYGSRILVVTHTYALSHFHVLQPLLTALTDSGHHVTALTFYPRTTPHPNYTDIDLRSVLQPWALDCVTWSVTDDILDLFAYSNDTCNTLFGSEPVQKFLKSGENFDLVIIEAFGCESILGFPAFFKVPYIAFSPFPFPPFLAEWMWNPIEASYVPDHMCRATDSDTTFARGYRLACQFLMRLTNWWVNTRSSVEMVRRHFHLDLDSLDEVKANISALFVNTVPVLGGVRPYLPNIVEIGGMHISQPKALPKDLSDWMGRCSSGVVVFSMGSMVKAASMDKNKRDSFVDIFGRLKECVLWKWEEELTNGVAKNIKTVSWMPQSDVLAHPNVRLFVAHGGIHGLLEAIHQSVPVVGLPLYGDQITNVKMLENQGAAVMVSYDPFDPALFEAAITNVLSNKSYQENMMRLSKITKDVDRTPLEKAVWWTEYILRHKGAPHLRHNGVHQKWWQYYLLDVFAAALASFALLLILLRASLKVLNIL